MGFAVPSSALVTGGCGFIGTHLVPRLAAGGCRVTVLDDLSAGRPAPRGASRFIQGDVRRPEDVARAAEGCDVFFHLAARVSVADSMASPALYRQVNLEGTQAVVQEARGRRVVFASTCSVYGRAQPPLREPDARAPVSPYGASKLRAERPVLDAGGVVLRYANVYGPYANRSYAAVVSIFADAIAHGRPVLVHGNGLQTRDFVYVADAVEATIRAASCRDIRPVGSGAVPGCQVLNVGTGRPLSVLEVAERVAAALGRPWTAAHGPARPGDPLHSWLDVSRAREVLSWEAEISFEEGLRRLCAAERFGPL